MFTFLLLAVLGVQAQENRSDAREKARRAAAGQSDQVMDGRDGWEDISVDELPSVEPIQRTPPPGSTIGMNASSSSSDFTKMKSKREAGETGSQVGGWIGLALGIGAGILLGFTMGIGAGILGGILLAMAGAMLGSFIGQEIGKATVKSDD